MLDRCSEFNRLLLWDLMSALSVLENFIRMVLILSNVTSQKNDSVVLFKQWICNFEEFQR